ncbi:ORF6N domain-containing protein [Xenorhabdus bovienii]|uniref:ORF6N domain-containing protein n=2 Tax=Xenorhabdus bovienii TaxID=40576 RepID=UPI0023B34574|nr:ORF6N domain-containing protein [Xenorhabdus bovienii]MDE9458818.1 ORF6N domain-containing protein [Xenorhabdus bovienii]MDE9487133.1 ORF6N domain-containing protein [Xenorhabdus bovienii]MDE9515049.1 ORF6N domain-containing protein [Xenorhabdus bovienii]
MINKTELITINKTQMPVVEYQGQRVVTFSMIDQVHARPEGTAKAAFNRNNHRFVQGVDYQVLSQDDIRTDLPDGLFSKFAPSGIVLFESGYLMLTKPFNDDVAWQVQRELVSSYFRKPQTALSELEMIARIASHTAQQQRQINHIGDQVEQAHEAIEQIKRGTIPVGWIGFSLAATESGLTNPKCRTLAEQYNVPIDTVTIMTPDGQPRPMKIVFKEDFISAFRLMMSEAEKRGTRWTHPKMGIFQVIGWEGKQ